MQSFMASVLSFSISSVFLLLLRSYLAPGAASALRTGANGRSSAVEYKSMFDKNWSSKTVEEEKPSNDDGRWDVEPLNPTPRCCLLIYRVGKIGSKSA